MLRHDPYAMPPSIDSTIAGRFSASTSLDATMPMTPRCQPSPATTITVRDADFEIGVDRFPRLRDDIGLLLLPAKVLGVELLGERARFVGHCFRRRQAAAARRCPVCSCVPRR